MPERMADEATAPSSAEGDFVLDPFCGRQSNSAMGRRLLSAAERMAQEGAEDADVTGRCPSHRFVAGTTTRSSFIRLPAPAGTESAHRLDERAGRSSAPAAAACWNASLTLAKAGKLTLTAANEHLTVQGKGRLAGCRTRAALAGAPCAPGRSGYATISTDEFSELMVAQLLPAPGERPAKNAWPVLRAKSATWRRRRTWSACRVRRAFRPQLSLRSRSLPF